jgi:hypothetical protein
MPEPIAYTRNVYDLRYVGGGTARGDEESTPQNDTSANAVKCVLVSLFSSISNISQPYWFEAAWAAAYADEIPSYGCIFARFR